MNKRVLITVRGHDAPGITRDLSGVLAENGAILEDVEQVVNHGLLLLSFLVGFDDAKAAETADAALAEASAKHGLVYEARQVSTEDIRRHTTRTTHVVTLLGPDLNPSVLQAVSGVLAAAGVNIEKINKFQGGRIGSLELLVSDNGLVSPRQLKQNLLELNERFNIDVAVQRESVFRRSKRLVVMDMDSTLIACEVIDELAAEAGQKERVAAITERAMRGELDFKESLRERVSALKGMKVDALQRVAARIELTPGAQTLISVLHRLGYKTAVISGGFRFFTEHVKQNLGLDYAHANELEIEGGLLTGRVKGNIIDADGKADLLEDIARREGIGLDQVIAIGDGANDLKMLARAGLGIAFNAKRRVQEAADGTISGSLDSILYLLGITPRDVEELSQLPWQS